MFLEENDSVPYAALRYTAAEAGCREDVLVAFGPTDSNLAFFTCQ